MNREDITHMAREAGLPSDELYHPNLERFAALVAAHVRETEFKPDWNNYQQGRADGAAEEREACCSGKVLNAANINGGDHPHQVIEKYRAAIRARGQA